MLSSNFDPKVFRQKIAIIRRHKWKTKRGSQWQAMRDGFSFSGGDGGDDGHRKGKGRLADQGVTDVALENWETGVAIAQPASIERMVAFINEHLQTRRPLDARDFGNDVSLRQLCEVIGYAAHDAIAATYRDFLEKGGPHLDFVITDAARAHDLMNSLGGFYHAFRIEPEEGGSSLVARMGIVIAASVRIGGRNQFSLAASLSIPSRSLRQKHFRYVGLISHENALMCWNFRQQSGVNRDVAYFMTDAGDRSRSDVQRRGMMLTMAQTSYLPLSNTTSSSAAPRPN